MPPILACSIGESGAPVPPEEGSIDDTKRTCESGVRDNQGLGFRDSSTF